MPTTNERISLVNDTEDVTAVKAPPPGLILKSKMVPSEPLPSGGAHGKSDAETPPVTAVPMAQMFAAPTVPSSGPVASPPARPAAAKTTTNLTAANPTTKKPPLVMPTAPLPASLLSTSPAGARSPQPPVRTSPQAPRLENPATSPATTTASPARSSATASGPVPFIRPMAAPPRSATNAIATPPASIPAPTIVALAVATPSVTPERTERALATFAIPAPAPRAVVDLVPLNQASGPFLMPKRDQKWDDQKNDDLRDEWGARPAPPRSRAGLYTALAVMLLAGGAAVGWKQWWSVRVGRIEISTTPPGSIVNLEGEALPQRAPVLFERAPGSYAISVTHNGYLRSDRIVQLHAGQEIMLSIALAPVPAAVVDGIGDGSAKAASAASAAGHPAAASLPGGARHPGVAGPPPARPGMARSLAQLDAAFAARAGARARALSGLAQDDESAATPAPAPTAARPAPVAAATTPEASPPSPSAPPKSGASAETPAARTGASLDKATAFEKSPGLTKETAKELASTRTISGRLAKAQLMIDANADEYRVKLPPSLARAEMKLSAVVKMCVAADGSVADVKLLKGADPAVDAQIPLVLGKWRYRPLMVDGRPAPFCYVLRYEIAAP